MPEDATLRDAAPTADPNAAAAPAPAPEPKPAEAAPEPAKVADTDAAELGRILLESGYTKDNVNDILQSPQALASLRYMIENNPSEFLNTLERANPAAGEKFLESMADTYVKRYHKEPAAPAKGAEAAAGLMTEVEALRADLNQVRTERQAEQQRMVMAQVQARYNGRVDDIFGQDAVKSLGLTKSEARAMRAQLDKELASDPSVVQRVSNGNFVDVPRTFQRIVEEWGADRKAAAAAVKAEREGAANRGRIDLSNGAQPFMLDIPANASESWDATEDAFAKALEKTA